MGSVFLPQNGRGLPQSRTWRSSEVYPTSRRRLNHARPAQAAPSSSSELPASGTLTVRVEVASIDSPQFATVLTSPLPTSARNNVQLPFGSRPLKELNNAVRGSVSNMDSAEKA